jgi:hypothetical protein
MSSHTYLDSDGKGTVKLNSILQLPTGSPIPKEKRGFTLIKNSEQKAPGHAPKQPPKNKKKKSI